MKTGRPSRSISISVSSWGSCFACEEGSVGGAALVSIRMSSSSVVCLVSMLYS